MKIEKAMCTGCGACCKVCPQDCLHLVPDQYGFPYPEIDGKCINCGICDLICPVLHKHRYSSQTAYAAWSRDEEIRMRSSSGGVFTVLAERILSDMGSVYGAVYAEDFSVRHERISNVKKCNGAKYVQSNLDNTFHSIKEDLENGRPVLFSGTPCQNAGLKSFLQKDYGNLICVDFICHGVPSPHAWRSYIKFREKKDTKSGFIRDINLRSKKSGWSHYAYSVEFSYSDGAQYLVPNGDDIYMKMFVNDYINRLSCSACAFKGENRCSDITLGDFWGIWDLYPDMDDNKGVSSVIVSTEKGGGFIKACSDDLYIRRVSLEDVNKWNPSYRESASANPLREAALYYAVKGKYDFAERLLFSDSPFFRLRRKLFCKQTRNEMKEHDRK